ncbi:alpha/beta hydrolase [Planotetraspora sp. A-T 1434]|uniref:alpha/beta hydrolase n=1 Tax=Planotetraspora sp. A-T 1434 TaxID=2979219 RepID=UPI0021BE3E11|nr:alpha/beta hydrolase [Planotetraspora sp. A-T 1434]MCT9933655.1 alpha/beta hydrolase [Planotetraspora sp. A-T 1434]
MSRRVWQVVLAGIVGLGSLGVGATACGSGQVTTAGYATPHDPLAWKQCEKVSTASGFQCATMKVPLDYAKPDGEKIGIALIRLRATDPAQRLGSLVFNFGGPGGSGVSTLLNAASAFGILGRRYDLVSFDPRGVDRSSGIRCLSDQRMDQYLTEEPSDSVDKETALLTEFARGCQRNAGKILPYVGTINAARDMESLRDALGEPQLNYFGFSYGTHLGAVYATQYPKKVGRMVLDAALDPTVGLLDMAKTQSLGFQRAYDDYLADCAKTKVSCPLGADPATANATVLGLLDTLGRQPLKVGAREVNATVARSGITQALYSRLAWPLLTEAVNDARRGDGSGLLTLADEYAGRQPNGSYSTLQFSLPAVLCADHTDRPTVAQAVALADRLRKVTPLFASTASSSGICSVWPVPGEDSNKHIDATGSKPIVVVGVTHDPATPYQWAPSLTKQLRTAVLLTLNGEGHGAYGQSACIDTAVNGYLLDGRVPLNGLRC